MSIKDKVIAEYQNTDITMTALALKYNYTVAQISRLLLRCPTKPWKWSTPKKGIPDTRLLELRNLTRKSHKLK